MRERLLQKEAPKGLVGSRSSCHGRKGWIGLPLRHVVPNRVGTDTCESKRDGRPCQLDDEGALVIDVSPSTEGLDEVLITAVEYFHKVVAAWAEVYKLPDEHLAELRGIEGKVPSEPATERPKAD